MSSLAMNPLTGSRLAALSPPAASRTASRRSVFCTASGDNKVSVEGKVPVALPDFEVPEPKRFAIRSDQWATMGTGALSASFRLGTGAFAEGWTPSVKKDDNGEGYSIFRGLGYMVEETSDLYQCNRPVKPIEMYAFQGCPFCVKAREGLNVLGLPALYYPTPQGDDVNRGKALEMAEKGGLEGRNSFPMIHDPNTGRTMRESDDILAYLYETYGPRDEETGAPVAVALPLRLGLLTTLTCGFSTLARGAAGSKYEGDPAKRPEQPLEYWGYEPSPFCKPVQETLSKLGLPHVYHTTPRGAPSRDALIKLTGRFQVPYLVDPNTGVAMFESAEIVEYLEAQYK